MACKGVSGAFDIIGLHDFGILMHNIRLIFVMNIEFWNKSGIGGSVLNQVALRSLSLLFDGKITPWCYPQKITYDLIDYI